jgi:hypothetical protein
MISEFTERLFKEIEQEIHSLATIAAEGKYDNMADYKFACGRILALKDVLKKSREIIRKMNQE